MSTSQQIIQAAAQAAASSAWGVPRGNVFFDYSLQQMRRDYEIVFGAGSAAGMTDALLLARYQELAHSPQFRDQVAQVIIQSAHVPLENLNPFNWEIAGVPVKYWLLIALAYAVWR